MKKAEEADETYKAEHCILCPKCMRLIERLKGCDLMVCGRNYHGGDQQDGCGHSFNITKAPKYKRKKAYERKVDDSQIVEKPQPETKHEIIEGVSLMCDVCRMDIVGPRFECIHCPSYNCCAGCEARLGDGIHPPTHVFRLFMRSSQSSSGQEQHQGERK
jgi:hypothetical protein